MSLLLSVVAVLAGLLGDDDRDVECLLLAAVDQARAAAFAAADPELLDEAYLDRGVAASDRAAVDSYRRRGIRVIGAAMHRESCALVERARGRITLDVVERLAQATAVAGGSRLWRLPRDHPTRHRVSMVETPDGWRIADVQ
jgi:hypothetical protein